MKKAFFIITFAVLTGCQEKDPAPGIQKELFPYLIKYRSPADPKCDPAFVTLRNEELTVFCSPLLNPAEENHSEFREMVKSETTSLVMKWSNDNNRNLKSIVTRFTDEIVTEPTK